MDNLNHRLDYHQPWQQEAEGESESETESVEDGDDTQPTKPHNCLSAKTPDYPIQTNYEWNITDYEPTQPKEALNVTESTGVTQPPHKDNSQSLISPRTENKDGEETKSKKKRRKKNNILNKKVAFYVKDARYDVVKRIGKKEFEWRNTYKDEEECNIIWSDIGLQPERLQNMKPYQ